MNNKYLLNDLVQKLADAGFERREADAFARSLFTQVEEAIFRDGMVKVQGLGIFRLVQVEARQSVNVNTGEKFEIDAHYKLSFSPDQALKTKVNAPFAHLETVALDASDTADALDVSDVPSADEACAIKAENASEPVFETTCPAASGVSSSDTSSEIKEQTTENNMEKEEPAFEVEETSQKKEKKKGGAWAWIVFALIVIALVIFALFNGCDEKSGKQPNVVAEQIDEQASVQAEAEEAEKAEETVDAATWDTYKEITLQRGQWLAQLSQKYYGHRVFWVYIYQANRDVMRNPNDLKPGVKIRIPMAPASVVDPNSEASIAKAQALEDQYRAQFAK